MERLRKARDHDIHNDIVDAQKNFALIRSPADGLKVRHAKEETQWNALLMNVEDDEEKIEYLNARQLEKQLEESTGQLEDAEMMKAPPTAVVRGI